LRNLLPTRKDIALFLLDLVAGEFHKEDRRLGGCWAFPRKGLRPVDRRKS
jgi:hypothetical protein